jgi:CcmD family protein
MKFLVAAYVVAWAIHLSYLGWLARGYRKVREELKELER